MDRMKDSGSFDWGSSPHGITTDQLKPVYSFDYTGFSILMGVSKNLI